MTENPDKEMSDKDAEQSNLVREKVERPLECSECRKSVEVYYSEIIGQNVMNTCMCKDCPILQQKLHGAKEGKTTSSEEGTTGHTGLCCGNCGTTLDLVRTGSPLGCGECYNVFADVLVMDMLSTGRISQRQHSKKPKKSMPIHIGRAPGEAAKVNPSLRLIALNEALNETLAHEDYEQAAWLRDQIKELSEKTESTEKDDDEKEK